MKGSDCVLQLNNAVHRSGTRPLGQLKSNGFGLPSRLMTAEAIDGFFGYKVYKNWSLGLNLNYRIQQQQTSLTSSGGTNLAGKGYIFGFGTFYRLNDRWGLSGAFGFLGQYGFDHQTINSEDDHLAKPLSAKIKAHYFLSPCSNLSIDGAGDYTHWGTFHVGGVDHSKESSQWATGVGVTFHLGGIQPESCAGEALKVEKHEVELQPAQKIEPQQKSVLSLPSSAFSSGSSKLAPEFKNKVIEVAKKIHLDLNEKILVRGHTDNIGSAEKNKKLSLARAESVKSALKEGGVSDEKIRTEGLGSFEPLSDNTTLQGRAANRRVEIKIVGEP